MPTTTQTVSYQGPSGTATTVVWNVVYSKNCENFFTITVDTNSEDVDGLVSTTVSDSADSTTITKSWSLEIGDGNSPSKAKTRNFKVSMTVQQGDGTS